MPSQIWQVQGQCIYVAMDDGTEIRIKEVHTFLLALGLASNTPLPTPATLREYRLREMKER